MGMWTRVLVGLGAFALVLVGQLVVQTSKKDTLLGRPVTKDWHDLETSPLDQSSISNHTILPGELPGYTGWPRPRTSLVSYFGVDPDFPVPRTSVAGQRLSFRVACSHPLGKFGRSLFYVRAYGPSVITGAVQDLGGGSYNISMFPFDAGRYQLEVVLTFSSRPRWSELPVVDQPGYEGYLLPGFPKTIDIHRDSQLENLLLQDQDVSRPCSTKEMLQEDFYSPLYNGRWMTYAKLRHAPYWEKSSTMGFTSNDYAAALNGLGIIMEYMPTIGCRLLTRSEVHNQSLLERALRRSKLPKKPLHVVFVGDSNIQRQMDVFQTYFNNTPLWQSTWVLTNEGLVNRMAEIRKELAKLRELDHNFFVIFNAGLHDIDQ